MQTITLISAVLLVVLALAAVARFGGKPEQSNGSNAMLFANIAEGVHEEFITRLPDAAVGTRFLLAKIGTDVKHADICGATDFPIGVFQDETGTTTDLTVPIAIGLLGASDETRKVAINSTVTLGDILVPATSGYAKTLPATGGKYNRIGIALQAGVAGDVIEFDPLPGVIQVATVYALTSTNGTAGAAADLTALKAEAENIGDDVRAIHAALVSAGIISAS